MCILNLNNRMSLPSDLPGVHVKGSTQIERTVHAFSHATRIKSPVYLWFPVVAFDYGTALTKRVSQFLRLLDPTVLSLFKQIA